jgi:hypothetical protein
MKNENIASIETLAKKRVYRKKIQEPIIEEEEEVEEPPKETEEAPEEEVILIKTIKKPRSQAQMDAFERAKTARSLNTEKRKQEREQEKFIYEQEVEQKLIKKAISLKKQQIRDTMIIDKIPDYNDDHEEEIKKVVQKEKMRKKIVFV